MAGEKFKVALSTRSCWWEWTPLFFGGLFIPTGKPESAVLNWSVGSLIAKASWKGGTMCKLSTFDISLSSHKEGFSDFIDKNIYQENYPSWCPGLESADRIKWPRQVVLRIHSKNNGLSGFSAWLGFDLPDDSSSLSYGVCQAVSLLVSVISHCVNTKW